MSILVVFSAALCMLLMLPLMVQPLSLGLVIMLSTLFMCLISAITLSSWYGYILFLIYVGGLLVMFAYVAALSPNILFGKGTPIVFFVLSLFPLMIIFYLWEVVDLPSLGYQSDFSEFKFFKVYGVELVSPQMVSVLIGLAVILLINLVVVVKICCYRHSSLRPFSKSD